MPSEENITKKYISEWFLERDQLVIPDLGKFEASYVSAQLEPASHKALPPNQTIAFEADSYTDDQAFAEFIAQREDISLSEAQKNIKVFVTTLKAELGIQKSYRVPHLGTFLWTPSGHIAFESEEDSNHLGDSFGLPELYNVSPVNTSESNGQSHYNTQPDVQTEETTYSQDFSSDDTHSDFEIEHEEVSNKPARRLFTVVTIVLVLLCVCTVYFLFNPMQWPGYSFFSSANTETNTEDEEIPDVEDLGEGGPVELDGNGIEEIDTENPGSQNEASSNESEAREAPADPPPGNDDPNDDPPLVDYSTNQSYISSFVYNPRPPANLNQILLSSPTSRYYVVLGSFDKQGNAYSFYNNLVNKGVNTARIIPPGGSNARYRVTYNGYTSREEARAQGRSFGSQHSLSLWVLYY